MKTKPQITNQSCTLISHQQVLPSGVRMPGLAALALALAVSARAQTPPLAIPFSAIGARATADYHGDALNVKATDDGARLRCGFQKLQVHATPEGLWLESTAPGAAGKLRVLASDICRTGPSTLNPQPSTMLPATGMISLHDNLVHFTRPGLTEEYSVSVDGVRQDFVIAAPPAGGGDLRVELALSGARAAAAAGGARLRLDGSGRVLAYSRLRAEDATGRELTARLEVLSADRLAVSVSDANATYPVRIDPTFSDADWVSLNPGMPGADGEVLAIVADASGNVYVAGAFNLIGTVPANGIAKWEGSAWSALGSGTGYYVNALAVSGTNLYAGGSFGPGSGGPANHIAKWDGSAWSALGSGVDGMVEALAVSGTNLYAGGYFTTAGGVTVNGIAKWNGSAWSPLGSGMSGTNPVVYALAVRGTDLYAGGSFTTAGGVTVNGIAKWDGSAWSALGSGVSWSYYGGVYALAVNGTNLYAGGGFFRAGGVTATNIAKWDGTTWSPLGSGIGESWESVYALAVWGSALYAGGSFTTAGGVTVNHIAKWDGSAWSALGSGMNNYVWALAGNGTNLYAGGWFAGGWPGGAGGLTADRIARWDGSAWSAFGSGMNNEVDALAVRATDLYAGGRFTTAGGVRVNCIAKWDGTGWSALGSGMDDLVYAVAVSGTNLYAGGVFTTAGGVTVNHIAKWDGNGWSALGSGVNNTVWALAADGTNLYAVVTVNGIAKWDGSAWSPLGSGMGGTYPSVYALAVTRTDLYAGGMFTTAGGVPANHIAKWDGTTWSPLGSGVSDPYNQTPWVSALAITGTDLYAGGDFGTAGGVTVNGIAKWDGSAWSALSSGLHSVNALAVSGTDLYAGGLRYVAKWDGSAWSPLGSGVNNQVYALAADGAGHLFVGGAFSLAGTNVSPFVAQANLPSGPAILRPPQTQTAEAGAVVDFWVNASGSLPLFYVWYFNATNLLGYGTNCWLELTNVQSSQIGNYTVAVTNALGAVTSAPAMLNVIQPVERRWVPGLTLRGLPGDTVNLDATSTLAPIAGWAPLDSVVLTNTSQWYFDLTTPLPPYRFYRTWQSNTLVPASRLDLHLIPAITLTGNIGSRIRVDGINQFGPVDAWFTVDTVTLTSTSQLYFDVSVVGQPNRLWRLVQVP